MPLTRMMSRHSPGSTRHSPPAAGADAGWRPAPRAAGALQAARADALLKLREQINAAAGKDKYVPVDGY